MSADAQNPYSAPKTAIDKPVPAQAEIHRQGDLLVIPIGTTLPEVCLMTGRQAQGKYFDKKLTWAPQWIYLLLLLNLLVLFIVYLLVRKQGRLQYYLDGTVVTKMRNCTLASVITFPLTILLVVTGVALEVPALIGIPILIALVFILVVVIIYPRIKIKKIDKTYIYLTGVHPDAMERILSTANA